MPRKPCTPSAYPTEPHLNKKTNMHFRSSTTQNGHALSASASHTQQRLEWSHRMALCDILHQSLCPPYTKTPPAIITPSVVKLYQETRPNTFSCSCTRDEFVCRHQNDNPQFPTKFTGPPHLQMNVGKNNLTQEHTALDNRGHTCVVPRALRRL